MPGSSLFFLFFFFYFYVFILFIFYLVFNFLFFSFPLLPLHTHREFLPNVTLVPQPQELKRQRALKYLKCGWQVRFDGNIFPRHKHDTSSNWNCFRRNDSYDLHMDFELEPTD